MTEAPGFKTDSQNKRDRILRTAMLLLAERGFHNTPMSLIAKESGVAAGTIYHYFSGKDEVINQLYLELKSFWIEEVKQGIDISHTVRQAMRICWFNILNFYRNHPAEYRFFEQFKNSPFIRIETREKGMLFLKPLMDLIVRGQKEGILKDYPLGLVMALWYGPINTLIQQGSYEATALDDDMLESAEEACWQSIAR